jgi:hypothetical protein
MTRSYENSLNLVERHFLGAAVVKLRGVRRGIVRHLRRLFERPAVLHVSGDARRAKGVVADLRRDACGFLGFSGLASPYSLTGKITVYNVAVWALHYFSSAIRPSALGAAPVRTQTGHHQWNADQRR